MIQESKIFKIARIAASVIVCAGLMYFLFLPQKTPGTGGWLISLGMMFIFILSRRAGVYDKHIDFC
jgi:hypothetical protein